LVYVTGILSPDRTDLDGDQDEYDGTDLQEKSGGLEGIPGLVNSKKPSAAGMSFFVGHGVEKIKTRVTFGLYVPRNPTHEGPVGGNPDVQMGGFEEENGDDGPVQQKPEVPRRKPKWHRFSLEWNKEILVQGEPREDPPLQLRQDEITLIEPAVTGTAWTPGEIAEVHHVASRVKVDVRRVRLDDHATQITVTLVNGNQTREDPGEASPWLCENNNDLPANEQVNLGPVARVQKATLFQARIEAMGTDENQRPFVQSLIRNIPVNDSEVFQHMLLYRNQREIAIGHGCGTSWLDPDETGRSFGRVETDFIPSHEVLGLKYSIHDFEPLVINGQGGKRQTINVQQEIQAAVDNAMGWGPEGGDSRGLFVIERLSSEENLSICRALCDAYEKWLLIKEKEIPQAVAGVATSDETYSQRLENEANSNIARCREVLARMRRGIETLRTDPVAMESFKLANKAMHMQAERGFAIDGRDQVPTWRPFQLAFLLLSINSIGENCNIPERDLVDLIWFPTGGGKTEAYLGLMAYCLLHRRLRHGNNPDMGAGVCVITRYTLRLLTSQQFERATRLMCALELIRWENRGRLGQTPFKIGMYVGTNSTPNRFEDYGNKDGPNWGPGAVSVINRAFMENGDNHTHGTDVRHLRKCPWCGCAGMDTQEWANDSHYVVVGPDGQVIRDPKNATPNCSLQFRCTNNNFRPVAHQQATRCPFFNHDQNGLELRERGIPAIIVDEQIYREAPSVIIGTVDKFAQITWRQETGILFGKSGSNQKYPVPDLIIQDELHLISGPLGSVVGIYEAAIDMLCTSHPRNGSPRVRPKIIGSTATIRQAAEQISALYDRKVWQFPPPVLTAGDSFFATTDQSKAGRLYLGMMAAGQSGKSAFMKTAAPLLELQKSLAKNCRDTFYTLVAYFNSLRELSGTNPVCMDDLPPHMQTLGKNRSRLLNLGGNNNRERIEPRELTSRMRAGQISEILRDLGREEGRQGSIRVLLCTNMISVGVDVPRLGLMLINGMPKTVSEYIQATSRVGRDGPGIVVTIFGWNKSRDRSYYEKFKQFHQSFYRYVEATSVTCWTSRVRDRAMEAVMVAMMRHMVTQWQPLPGGWPGDPYPDFSDYLLTRLTANDPEETEDSRAFLEDFKKSYENWIEAYRQNKDYGYGSQGRWGRGPEKLLRTPQAPRGLLHGLIPAAQSLRDVEPETGFELTAS
jgi:hypothetical protein